MPDGEREPIREKNQNRTPGQKTGGIPWRSQRCAINETRLTRRVQTSPTHLDRVRQKRMRSLPTITMPLYLRPQTFSPKCCLRIVSVLKLVKRELFCAANQEAVRVWAACPSAVEYSIFGTRQRRKDERRPRLLGGAAMRCYLCCSRTW